MPVTIRAIPWLSEPDTDQLAALLREVVGQGASIGFLSVPTAEDARTYWHTAIHESVLLLVAEIDGRLVGTVQLHRATEANARHRATVTKLMVHPSEQRRGIARALMQHLEQVALAEGRTLLVLDTRSGDVSSDLYRSMGYVEVGRIPRFARLPSGALDSTVLFYKELG